MKKYLEFVLGNWEKHNYNFWRTVGEEMSVGLIHLTSVNDIKNAEWQIDWLGGRNSQYQDTYEARKIFMEYASKKIFKYSELEQAKQEVDDLIQRINKLKSFI